MTDLKVPFAYFGKKTKIAPTVWQLLGDPANYVEPFAGSAAVLLARPGMTGNTHRYEVINDADGLVTNFYRAVQSNPDNLASMLNRPPNEIDLQAARISVKDSMSELVPNMRKDLGYFDTEIAAAWCYYMCCEMKPKINVSVNSVATISVSGIGVSSTQKISDFIHPLANRLKDVVVMCGGWERMVTPARMSRTPAVFFDPPYSGKEDIYTHKSIVSDDVREWCKEHSDLRIVLCGYDDEHDELLQHGWGKQVGKQNTPARCSLANSSGQERLWYSPACSQPGLF